MDQSTRKLANTTGALMYRIDDIETQANILRAQIGGINAARIREFGEMAPLEDVSKVIGKAIKRVQNFYGTHQKVYGSPRKPKLQAAYDKCIANNPCLEKRHAQPHLS